MSFELRAAEASRNPLDPGLLSDLRHGEGQRRLADLRAQPRPGHRTTQGRVDVPPRSPTVLGVGFFRDNFRHTQLDVMC